MRRGEEWERGDGVCWLVVWCGAESGYIRGLEWERLAGVEWWEQWEHCGGPTVGLRMMGILTGSNSELRRRELSLFFLGEEEED